MKGVGPTTKARDAFTSSLWWRLQDLKSWTFPPLDILKTYGFLLVCDWPHSDWTKSLICKDAFHRDSTIQKCFRWFCTVYKLEISFPCQPSGRRVIPSGRSSVHSSSFPEDVPYHPDARQTKASSVRTMWISVRTLLYIEKLLFQLASIQTSQQPVRTTLSDRSFRFFFQVHIREDCWNRPDDVDSHPDALTHKARITIQIQPSGCQSAMVQTRAQQIWKLRLKDQPSRRPSPWSGRAKP